MKKLKCDIGEHDFVRLIAGDGGTVDLRCFERANCAGVQLSRDDARELARYLLEITE